MKQAIKTGKGLLWRIEHPVEISYSEITLDSLLKLCEKDMKWIPKYQKAGKLNFKTSGLPWQQSKQDQETARNAQSTGTLNPTNLKRRLQPVAKNLKAKYNNLSTKERIALAKRSMPHSEIVTVRDQQGNTKTSTNPQAGAMSGADPVGEFIVGTAVGNLGLGLGKMALSKIGQNAVSHWARNSLLNEAAGNLTKNVSQGITNNLAAKEYTTGDNPIMQLSYYKPTRKAWSTGKAEGNEATSYFFKQQPNQRFELVKDVEPNNYSVHFKTDRNGLNYGNKMQLFAKVADEVPEGANLSTWGSVSKGGIHGINRFGKNFGFIQNGTRQLTMKGTKEPVEVGVFQKPLNHHLQGEDAIKMFKEYGGTPIPEGSLNGDQLRKYVIEARERYGLMDNPNISDEEIAQALYKHTNELGKGSAAINSQGEPQLLFRGDTKAYTQLKDHPSPTDLATKSGTMDNSLGTLFLGELPGTGQKGQGLERYLVRGQEFNGDPKLIGSGTGAKVLGGDGKYHTEIRQIIPKDARPLVTYPTRFGDNAVYKLPAKYSESKTNNINAFVVRTPAVRDASKEISVLNDDWLIKGGSKVNYHGPLNPTNERSAMAEHYNYVLKDAQKKQQGLLKSNPNSPLRDEHDDYTYFAVPNWNKSNVKSLLPYDLRIPRNWSDPNIFRIAAPIGMSLPFLNNSQK